jgi:hypothetical protein
VERLRALRGWLRAFNDRGLFSPGASPLDARADLIVIGFAALWQLFSGYVAIETGHFHYDQAYFYEQSLRVAQLLELPAYGPFISGKEIGPMTPGGMLWVAYAPPFFFSNDPRAGHAWILFLAFCGAVLFDRAQKRLGVAPSVRLATLALYLTSAAHARNQATFWNGDFFLFLAPALLYFAVRIATNPSTSARWCAAFGAAAALGLQTHISSGMAIALCLALVALVADARPPLRALTLGALFFLAMYAPYLVHEARHGWPNAHLLAQGVPRPGRPGFAFVRALWVPVFFTSHLEHPWALGELGKLDWTIWVAAASAGGALALGLLGLVTRHPMKVLGLLAWLGTPFFFLVTRRDYFDHYVLSVVPFGCSFAGAGLGWLIAQPGWKRTLGAGYAVFTIASGAALLATHLHRNVLWPGHPYEGQTVKRQLERVRAALASGAPHPSPNDRDHEREREASFVFATLAHRVEHRELLFAVEGKTCGIAIRLTGFSDQLPWEQVKDLSRVGDNTGWRCPP